METWRSSTISKARWISLLYLQVWTNKTTKNWSSKLISLNNTILHWRKEVKKSGWICKEKSLSCKIILLSQNKNISLKSVNWKLNMELILIEFSKSRKIKKSKKSRSLTKSNLKKFKRSNKISLNERIFLIRKSCLMKKRRMMRLNRLKSRYKTQKKIWKS